MKYQWQGYVYRFVMRLSHKFNWHYMPQNFMGDGRALAKCSWCGLCDEVYQENK